MENTRNFDEGIRSLFEHLLCRLYLNHVNFSEPSWAAKKSQIRLLKNRIPQEDARKDIFSHWCFSFSVRLFQSTESLNLFGSIIFFLNKTFFSVDNPIWIEKIGDIFSSTVSILSTTNYQMHFEKFHEYCIFCSKYIYLTLLLYQFCIWRFFVFTSKTCNWKEAYNYNTTFKNRLYYHRYIYPVNKSLFKQP